MHNNPAAALLQVERKLEEAEQQLQQHSNAQAAGQEQQLQLTPRPAASDWGPAQQLACACMVSSGSTLLLKPEPQVLVAISMHILGRTWAWCTAACNLVTGPLYVRPACKHRAFC